MWSLQPRPEGRDRPPTIISPSLLSSDFARLASESESIVAKGADWLHVDVMDGHFVPNLTLGAPIVKSLRASTTAFLDCHLMVTDPGRWVDDFAAAGASMYTFHLEAVWPAGLAFDDAGAVRDGAPAVRDLLRRVRGAGMLAGLTIKPATPVETVFPYLDDLDMVLIMTVEPGFGGQRFQPAMMDKVAALRARSRDLYIEVDGGLAPDTIAAAAAAGANVVVAGSAVFGVPDRQAAITQLRSAVDAAATA